MEHLINPRGLDPEAAYDATLAALMEQIETRVNSVDNGETYMRAHPGTPIPMPSGPAIFETTGPWEDYATPSRDMRLLIALKVLEGLPERIRRYPELYVLRGEESGRGRGADRAAPCAAHPGALRRLYPQRREPLASQPGRPLCPPRGLEVGYNPNDCVERRWGASPGPRTMPPAAAKRPLNKGRGWRSTVPGSARPAGRRDDRRPGALRSWVRPWSDGRPLPRRAWRSA